jgi:hypothetical protein
MKKFKHYITEVQRYQSGGRHTLYPYMMPPPGLFPPSQINPNNPMMTPGWATDPYWSPAGTDEGDWSFGIPWLEDYSNTTWDNIPGFLKVLWGLYYGVDSLPGIGDLIDAADLFLLFQQWADSLGMDPMEYEDYIQQLLRFLRDHNIPIPEHIPQVIHQAFYMRMPDGRYQYFRWNSQTGQYEPVGESIPYPPEGENVPPVFDHPDYRPPKPIWGTSPPSIEDPNRDPNYLHPIVPKPFSPTQTPYQWGGNNENPMISGMGG